MRATQSQNVRPGCLLVLAFPAPLQPYSKPEPVYLLQRHEILWAGLYVFLTVSVGLLALWLGMSTVR